MSEKSLQYEEENRLMRATGLSRREVREIGGEDRERLLEREARRRASRRFRTRKEPRETPGRPDAGGGGPTPEQDQKVLEKLDEAKPSGAGTPAACQPVVTAFVPNPPPPINPPAQTQPAATADEAYTSPGSGGPGEGTWRTFEICDGGSVTVWARS